MSDPRLAELEARLRGLETAVEDLADAVATTTTAAPAGPGGGLPPTTASRSPSPTPCWVRRTRDLSRLDGAAPERGTRPGTAAW